MTDIPWDAVERLRDRGNTKFDDRYELDKLVVAQFALALCPDGPRPVPIKNPAVGQTAWLAYEGGVYEVGYVVEGYWVERMEAWYDADTFAAFATEADARCEAQWQAWDQFNGTMARLK